MSLWISTFIWSQNAIRNDLWLQCHRKHLDLHSCWLTNITETVRSSKNYAYWVYILKYTHKRRVKTSAQPWLWYLLACLEGELYLQYWSLTICRPHHTVHVCIPTRIPHEGCVQRRYRFQDTWVICLAIIDSYTLVSNSFTCWLTSFDTATLYKLIVVPVDMKVGDMSPVQET